MSWTFEQMNSIYNKLQNHGIDFSYLVKGPLMEGMEGFPIIEFELTLSSGETIQFSAGNDGGLRIIMEDLGSEITDTQAL